MTSLPVRRGLVAVTLLLLAVASPLRHAAAQSDPYTAMVTVDATSDSVAKARDMARTDGARRALNAVIEKLAGGPDKVKPLKLSDNQVTDLVASFEVANEKMSAVRYVADYTYHFKSGDVAKVMQNAGIAVADTSTSSPNPAASPNAPASPGGRAVVVLPVYQEGDTALLWDDPNPWREAWAQRAAGTGGTTLLVPLGDVSDVAAIDSDKARLGDAGALAAIGKKEGTDDVLVLLASKRPGDKPGLDVTARRYRAGKFIDAHFDAIDGNPGEQDSDLLPRAVNIVAADIDNNWKNAKGPTADQQGSLVVAAPITSLDDWIRLRETLATVPALRKVDLKSLSRQEAVMEIQYLGTLDQLKANLAAIKLDLQGGDPTWRLARSGFDKP